MIEYELPFWEKGLLVAGVDEAGRGPLAGPVVACALILPPFTEPFIDRDSKRMSAREREEAYELIKSKAIAIGTAVVDSVVIDRINIHRAVKLAMKRALEDLKHPFDVVITDFVKLEGYNCLPLVKGDEKSLSCACASVVAKVLRDRIMEHYHKVFPQYEFAQHKGYPTRRHRELIKTYGFTEIHRRSFKTLRYGKTGF
ncbi:Ribonuclease H [Hydrogenobacter thermophilus TK-6]|uniref:Ribonuclease HII n=1 Tax=Hydrogenobacter thermophilus (strain DSM 6534 / IAM 12695 / TK-6) TaxID=608538 RepID=D3DJ96_HYDTT|nr:ribonuclease HII [Hydrogenobacter thermophilus]ADO45821.1 Ribonuclease H [Hydrogenobacter thermophilus TK-6]BAI69898.1 ribonuclease HII [Hydrogenobacter thermophilus TK-6]